MIIVSTFVVLVFLYSLISHRLERTIITAPILFTCAGMLLLIVLPVLGQIQTDRKAFNTGPFWNENFSWNPELSSPKSFIVT